MGSDRTELRAISPDATPEEVAAIVAAVTRIDRERRAAVAQPSVGGPGDGQRLSHWRASSRLSGRRAGMTRGPWRLSGRLTRRTRA